MEENKNTKPVNNKRNGIIILCIVLTVCIIGFYRTYTVKKNGVYTIATIYNITVGRSGRDFECKYFFKGKEYKDFGSAPYIYMSDEGARFFVQILPDNPERRWLYDIRVPDSITEAPYEGWKELPIQVQE